MKDKVADEEARLLGHFVQPIQMVFPLAPLTAGGIFEIVYHIKGNHIYSHVTYWILITGIITALLAAIFARIDWFPVARRGSKILCLNARRRECDGLNPFTISWYFRTGPTPEPTMLASLLAFAGFPMMGVGIWLGSKQSRVSGSPSSRYFIH